MYENFYRFTAKPFQLSPNPRFFYSSSTHKRALAYLRYGVQQGEGFIVITGDVGTGKTTLVTRLFESLDADKVVAAKVTNTQIKADDLLRMVAAEFGLSYQRTSKAALLHSLELFFRGCVQEGKRVLVVVDEAQNLPRPAIEELRMLSNFQWNGRPLLQSFLLGQKEFRNTMRSDGFEQLRQRIIAAYHLRPLTAEETRAYIEHRLKLVGWRGDPRITDDAFTRIHEFSGGIPRKTNLLCDRILLYGSLEELHTIDSHALSAVFEDVRQELWQPADSNALSITGEAPFVDTTTQASISGPRPALEAQRLEDSGQNAGLKEVEESMRAMTESLRAELAELKQAILAGAKKDQDDNSNP